MKDVSSLRCLCASIRRASRALTQLYGEALRKTGIQGTQFTVLQVLARAGEVSQGTLGEILAMDSTTLTRTLAILRRRGWIRQERGRDRREWRLSLTKSGQAQLKRGTAVWEMTQRKLEERLGATRWRELLAMADEITALAQKEGDRP